MSTIDKISEIKDIFEDIADAIEKKGVEVGECDKPETYPNKILKIVGDESDIPLWFDADWVEGDEVAVDYRVDENGTGVFHFTLARGPKGEDGKDGTDGAHGADGKDGVDGTDIQFIFARTNNGTPDQPESDPDSDALPTGGNITWHSVPQGVDDDHIYEYVCKRVKDPTTKKWGEYSAPAIWAQWGKVGKDGNGIEYIFCLTDSENNIPTVPNSDPNKSEDEIAKWPLESGSYKWYDDPPTVSETNPCCWVSVRKQSTNEVDGIDVQTWGNYSPASLWSKYSKDGIDGGGRTVFAYCASSTKPSKPLGGSWDPKTNTATAPYAPGGENVIWYLNPVSIEKGQHLYQSNASFDSTGKIQEEWSDPVRITGEDGVNGADGESIQFIYRLIPNKSNFDLLSDWHSDNEHALPSDPTGDDKAPEKTDRSSSSKPGWNLVENGSETFWTICDTEWTDEPKGIDGVNYLIECACTRTKKSVVDETTGESKEEWGPWSKPFLWAVWGEDGIDGTGVEYIYLVTPKTHVFYENGEEIIREITGEDLKLPTKAEYQAYDGVHKTDYVSLFEKSEFIPGHTDNNIFNILYHADNAGWTDEPRDVSQNQPIEWVAIRKKAVKDGEHTGEWEDFSIPVIWNKWVTDGTSFKTAFAFTRTDEDLTKVTMEGKPYIPTGGSYTNPVPGEATVWLGNKSINLTWHDTIPEGTEKVWMTSRLFSANEFVEEADTDWSIPTPMTDSSIMQIEFAQVFKDEKGEHEDVIPTPAPFQEYYDKATGERDEKLNNAESAWREFEKGKNWHWNDGEKISDPMWMAVCYQRNGKWTDWTVTRVKGERGTAGKNGTSVTILGSANEDSCQFNPTIQQTLPNNQPAKFILKNCENVLELYEWSEEKPVYIEKRKHNNGDGYLVGQDLWVWDGDSFENVGQIKGEPGENAHLYIAFSNDAEVQDTTSNVLIDLTAKTGKYIGYLTSSYEVSEEALKKSSTYTYWTKWTGDDGWGYEQIYLLTKEVHNDDLVIDYDNGPLVPKRGAVTLDEWNTAGYLPFVDEQYKEYSKGSDDAQGMRWFDVPQSPTAEYPYCWVAHRNTSDWEWKGQWVYDEEAPDNSYYRAALYSRYVPDLGHLELDNDNLVVPLDSGNIDSDFTAAVTLSFYYAGKSVENDVQYYYKFDESDNWSEISESVLNIYHNSKLNKYIYFKATYNGVDYYKNCTIRKVDNAYRLTVSNAIIHKDATYDPEEITCSVQKWSGDTWNDSPDTSVYYNVDNEGEKTYTSAFNCSEEQPQKHVRFYIKDSEGNILDFEDVAVVTDGTSAYHLQLSEDHVTVPLTSGGEIDEDYSGFDITATLYAGDIALDEGIKYSYKLGDSEETENKDELITIKPELLAGKPDKLTVIATRGSEKWSKDVRIDYNSIAYEMTVSKNIIRRDASTNKIVDTDDTIEVTIMKWSGTEWLAADDVTVNVNAWDVEDTPINIYPMSTTNGVATFEGLTEFDGLAGIKFYITDNHNAEIAHENVGVVVNGEDGAWQEFIYRVFDKEQESIADPTPRKDGAIDYDTLVNDKKYSDPEYVPADWTDNPEDLTTAGQYQYVSVRKKVNNQWQAFSTPVIWSYKPFDGEDGKDGVSPVVVSLSSNTYTLILSEGKLTLDKITVYVNALYKNESIDVTNVTLKDAYWNEDPVTNVTVGSISKGQFTVTVPNVEELGVFTVNLSFDTEYANDVVVTLNIIVQASGGENACHIELDNDRITTYKGNNTAKIVTATFYDGSQDKTSDVTWSYSGNAFSADNKFTISDFTKDHYVTVSASYNGSTYTKQIQIEVLEVSESYYLKLSPDIINRSKKSINDITVNVYKESDKESAQLLDTLPGGFTIASTVGVVDDFTIKDITRDLLLSGDFTVSLKQGDFLWDSETVGVLRDSLQATITLNQNQITQSSDGTVNSQTIIVENVTISEGDVTVTQDYKIKYSLDNVNYDQDYPEQGITVNKVCTIYIGVFVNNVLIGQRTIGTIRQEAPEDPEPPIQGKAPIIYPAGKWDSTESYNGTGNQAPYVYKEKDGKLLYFVAYGSIASETDPTNENNQTDDPDWNNIPESGKWVPMPKYNAIYADIGKFNTALVGNWVFYKDWMFSQDGVDANGEKRSYTNSTWSGEEFPSDFIPNIKLDAITGEGWFGAGKVVLGTKTDPTSTSIGGWKVTDNGLQLVEDDKTIALLNNNGTGTLGALTNADDNFTALSWDNEKITIGNSAEFTPNYLKFETNLKDRTYNGITYSEVRENVLFQVITEKGSIRMNSCSNSLVAIAPERYSKCYDNSAVLFVRNDNTYEAAIIADGNVEVDGILKIQANSKFIKTVKTSSLSNGSEFYKKYLASEYSHKYIQLLVDGGSDWKIQLSSTDGDTVTVASHSTILLYSDGTTWTV